MQIGKLAREEREMVLMLRQVRQEYPTEKLAIVPQSDLDDELLWQAQTEMGWKLMHKGFDDMIKKTGVCPREICECREDDCTPETCQGFCMRFLTEEEEEQCRKRAKLHAVVEKEDAETTPDGDGRAADGRGAGGRGEQAARGSVGGRPQ